MIIFKTYKFDDSLLRNHILIDFPFINEDNSVPTDVKIISHQFNSIVFHKITDFFKTTNRILKFDITESGLNLKGTFLDRINVRCNLVKSDLRETYSRYLFNRSYYSQSRKLFKNNAVIEINVSGFREGHMIADVEHDLEHELLHAYEDYCLRAKGNSLKKEGKRTNYFKKNITTYKHRIKQAISDFLYLTDLYERNAYIAQIESELIPFADYLGDSGKVMNIIKQTDSYGKFEVVEEMYEYILDANEDELNDIRKYFNEISPKIVNTNTELKNIIETIWIKYKQKYLSSIGKIAYSVYERHQQSSVK